MTFFERKSLRSRCATFLSALFLGTNSYADTIINGSSHVSLNTTFAGNITVTDTGDLSTTAIAIVMNNDNKMITNLGRIFSQNDGAIRVGSKNGIINNEMGANLINASGGNNSTIMISDNASFTLNNQGVIASQNSAPITIRVAGGFGNTSGTVINVGDIKSSGARAIDFDNGTPNNTILLKQNSGTIKGDISLGSGGGKVLEMNGGTIDGRVSTTVRVPSIINLSGGTITQSLNGGSTDIFNVTGGRFASLNAQGGTSVLNINDTFTTPGTIMNIPTINIAANKIFTVNKTIIGLNRLLFVSNNAKMIVAANVTGTGAVQNNGTLTMQESGFIEANTFTQTGGMLSIGLVDGTTFGKIALTGTGNVADLQGDLSVYFAGAVPEVQTDYDVVIATGGGRITDNTNFVSPSSINLQLRKWMPSPQILRITSTYHFYPGDTINAKEVAQALQEAKKGNPEIENVINAMGNLSTQEEMTVALESLSPDVDYGAVSATQVAFNQMFNLIVRRQALMLHSLALKESGFSAGDAPLSFFGEWGEVYGGGLKQKPMPQNSQGIFTTTGYHANFFGFMVGGDLGNDALRLGVGCGYSRSNVKSQMEFGNTVSIDSYQLSTYGWFQPLEAPFFTQIRLGLASNAYYNTRHIVVGDTLNQTALGHYRGLYYGTDIEMGYAFAKSHYYVAPVVRIKAARLNLDQYVEKGAGGLDLSVSDQMLDQFLAGGGFRLAGPGFYLTCPGFRFANKQRYFIPELNVTVLHDFTNADQKVTATFLGGGALFSTAGVKQPATFYEIGLGFTALQGKNYKVTARYESDFRKGFYAYSGYVQLYYFWR